MPAWDYPTPAELGTIAQVTIAKLEVEANSPFLDNFPDELHRDTLIMWEQLDNFTGLMSWRGYGNKPTRVNDVGLQRFMAQPGVYGDYGVVEEEALTRRRLMGSFSERMSANDLVAIKQKQLLVRRLQLKQKILSNFVVAGAYSVPDGTTGFVYTGDSWTPTSFVATTAWSDHANSTPMADLMAMQQLSFGQSVDFGTGAEFVVNQLKMNDLLLNRNAADFWGYRNAGGSTVGNDLGSINAVLNANGLPKLRVFDGFYLADNGTRKGSPTRLVPNGTGILFGRRSNGEKPGAFAMTANANNADAAPGPYDKVIYRGTMEVPTSIEVHHGFNGGPLIRYPGTIVVATGL